MHTRSAGRGGFRQPRTARHEGEPAIQQGEDVGRVIKDRLAGRQTPPFRYFDKGTMATIGYRSAVADAFGVKVTGFLAYVMWVFIHVMYLVGWGNRLGTLYTWVRALWLSHNRGNRIIAFETAQQEVAGGSTPAARPPTILPRTAPPAAPDAEEAIPGAPRETGDGG
jgi:NADH dehydrogenase